MGRPAVVLVGLVLAASAVAVPLSTGTAVGDGSLAQPEGFDRTVFGLTVYVNGTAEWVFDHRRVLEDDAEERDFRAYAETFETTETPLYRTFVDQSESLARVGTRQTGREMAARTHARSASVDSLGRTEGVVRLSFLWTSFGAETEEGVRVADVFAGGLVLGADQRMVFRGGPNLTFRSVRPDDYTPSGVNLTTSESVTFFGQKEFADRRPRVEFVRAGAADGPADGAPGTSVAVFAGLAVVVLGTVAALAWRLDLVGGSGSQSVPSDDVEATARPQPPEITSDSARVVELLEENGGRMKQVNIVDETGWSKSKVSMLLSDMEAEGEITKLRVGRENIVSLAGHEPDAAGSPFEADE